MTKTARVALTKGDDRRRNITRALDLIADQVDLRHKRRILIKPNFVVTYKPLAMTHVDAVRAVLDFLRPRLAGDASITIAESSASGDVFEAYKQYGYTDLVREYNVELADLNRGAWVQAPVYDTSFKDMCLRLARPVVDSDFRISVGPPKTHETVFVTLSLKNMVMGSLIRDVPKKGGESPVIRVVKDVARALPSQVKNTTLAAPLKMKVLRSVMHIDKNAMHMSYALMNLNLCRLAPLVYPHLAVIDGFVGMEGDGPVNGDPVNWRCAVAGSDFLAADTVAAHLMGFESDKVGYLHYCKMAGLGVGDLRNIEVLGNTLAECRHPFRPHPSTAQEDWRIEDRDVMQLL
jgi:uncharacterized protein (DUF362 family)